MIQCDQLSVRYGSTLAADRVSFAVEPGEVFGLLGPNGAGKTSVIRALTTIIEPDAGSARIDGVSLSEASEVRTRIGVLPESGGYPGSHTARAHLVFHGRLFGASRSQACERADELLTLVGLDDAGRQPISTFSRGMRQRLGIARSIVNRPSALFLDEPTLGLDPAGKQDVLDILRQRVRADGDAIVLCSHLLDEVERICDRIAIMHEGCVVAYGTVREVVASARVIGGARLDVAPPDAATVAARLNRLDGMRASTGAGSPGRIDVDLRPGGPTINDLATVLGSDGTDFFMLEARGARLSDAFLQLTGAREGRETT